MNSLTANQLLDKHKTIWTHTSRFDDPAALRLHRGNQLVGACGEGLRYQFA